VVGEVIVGPDIDDRSVVVVAAVIRRVIEDRSPVGEPGHGITARQVIDAGGRRGGKIRRVGKIIGAVDLVHEGGFKIPGGIDGNRGSAHADHIRIQFDNTGVPHSASPEIQVSLTVVVDKGRRVEDIGDGSDTCGAGSDERVAERVVEGARRAGGPENTDTAAAIAVVNIVITVPVNDVRRIGRSRPTGVTGGDRNPFVGPIHEVVGRHEIDVIDDITRLAGDVMGAIDVHPVVEGIPKRSGIRRILLVDQRVGKGGYAGNGEQCRN
jgi:hypothetical protein